jgi:hypothetical protein
MLSMLVAYDAEGNIVGTLDYMVAQDDDGNAIGLYDFEAIEEEGPLTRVWVVENAVGSGTWPEWIGGRAHEFKVERAGGKISALVHKQSGHRRLRAAVTASVAARIAEAGKDTPADIRDLVGGPDRPLLLDENGRTAQRKPVKRPALPIATARQS